VAGFESERWPASSWNGWPASDWNARPASSEPASLSVALHLGEGFLHWQGRRKARVLYLDGEMPLDLIKERIVQECARRGVDPADITDGLYILSHEDVEDMPPLDSEDGLAWLLVLIGSIGGVDLVVFDNLMCLTQGDLREETTWTALKLAVLELTRRRIGQWWVHHVGHDKSRPYGSKSFQWMMDLVLLGEAVTGHEDADVAFKLAFQKARRRTPDNRADFQDTVVVLQDGRWASQEASGPAKSEEKKQRTLGDNEALILQYLHAALCDHGREPHETEPDIPRGTRCVRLEEWSEATLRYLPKKAEWEKEQAFRRAALSLQRRGLVKHVKGWCWAPQPQ
jgi:hypothetical protein